MDELGYTEQERASEFSEDSADIARGILDTDTAVEDFPAEPLTSDQADSYDGSPAFASEQTPDNAYPDPVFNVPPILSKLEGLDRESFWAEVDKARPVRVYHKKTLLFFSFILFLISLCILLTTIYGKGWFIRLLNGGKNINFTLPIAETPKLDSRYYQPDGRYTVEGIANAVSPSVVSIEVYSGDLIFEAHSQGSGIIMSEDGYILTNAHVIEKGKKIKAVLYDRSQYYAELIGSDPAADIAVIKIAAVGLTPAQFGDSDSVGLGEDIVAIGSPAGFYGSVTKGIVSGVNRMIKVESFSVPMRCIQIDAAINPGNSGGALVNMWGQVVGITSSKLTSASYDGIGFAITMNSAKPIIEALMSQIDLEKRAYIGISFYSISEEAAELNGTKPGLLIATIDGECDIASTDLQSGDIITMLDGRYVSDSETVKEIVNDHRPGDRMTAKVFRPDPDDPEGGKSFVIAFRLMEDKGSFIEN